MSTNCGVFSKPMAPPNLYRPRDALNREHAAIILSAWPHPGRVISEAAFAGMAGTCPVPASSASTTRYRLNHGGSRQLNKTLDIVALSRIPWDQLTRDYVAKWTSQGRTKKEIIRSLKRDITRQIYRTLQSSLENGTAIMALPKQSASELGLSAAGSCA
jgi:hypothetical protein